MQLAGLSAGVSLLPAAAREPLYAQAEKPPRRLLILYTSGGQVFKHTHMRPSFLTAAERNYNPYDPAWYIKPDETNWEFSLSDARLTEASFSRVLGKLYRHRDIMTVLEGLSYYSTMFPDAKGDGHSLGYTGMLVGAPGYDGDGVRATPTEPSVDQRIHEHLLRSNPGHQVLNFQGWDKRASTQTYHGIHWSTNPSPGRPAYRVSPESDPIKAYKRLFSNFDLPDDPLVLGRTAALDVAVQEFKRISGKLPPEDRLKLEAHHDLLNQLRSQLAPTLACSQPLGPSAAAGIDSHSLYRGDIEAFARMIGASFACGLSQVATLAIHNFAPSMYGVPDSTDIHHTYEHPTDPFAEFGTYNRNPPADYTEKRDAMAARNEVTCEMVARVIDILREIPENGGSLMDNTLVLYVNDISHGNHGHEQIIGLLFGAGGGMVKPGRYIKYPQNYPNPYLRNYNNEFTGVPYSHLLVSLCQGMGLDLGYIGQSSIAGSAPHARVSKTISLTGGLPRLV